MENNTKQLLSHEEEMKEYVVRLAGKLVSINLKTIIVFCVWLIVALVNF